MPTIMRDRFNKNYLTIALYLFFTVVACMLFYVFLTNFSSVYANIATFFSILKPIIYGIVIAYLLNPVMLFVERCFEKMGKGLKSKKSKRVLSLIATYLIALLIIGIIILIVFPQVVESVSTLVNNFSDYSNNFARWVDETIAKVRSFTEGNSFIGEHTEKIIDTLDQFVSDFANRIIDFFPDIISFVTKISVEVGYVFVGIVFSIYMLFDKEFLIARSKKLFIAMTGKRYADGTLRVLRDVNYTIGKFISGKLLDALVIWIFTYILLVIFRIDFPLLLSVIIAITDLIPFFGPIIGAIPCSVILLITNPIQVIWFVLIIIVIQQIEGNIITPKIIGKTTGLSAFWVMVALIVAGGLFGLWGMLLGVPVFSVLYTLISGFVNRRLEQKGYSTDTGFYLNYPPVQEKPVVEKQKNNEFWHKLFKMKKDKAKDKSISEPVNDKSDEGENFEPKDL